MRITSGYSIFYEAYLLFKEMDALSFILLSAGLLFLIVEIFRPFSGILYGAGGVLIILGIAVRMSNNGSIQMLFILIFIIALLIVTAFIISVRVNKYNWLLREEAIDGSSFNTEPDTDSKDYYFLLNHEGVTVTELSPSGIIVINDIEFDAASQTGEEIPENTPVRVVEVENDKIIVRLV